MCLVYGLFSFSSDYIECLYSGDTGLLYRHEANTSVCSVRLLLCIKVRVSVHQFSTNTLIKNKPLLQQNEQIIEPRACGHTHAHMHVPVHLHKFASAHAHTQASHLQCSTDFHTSTLLVSLSLSLSLSLFFIQAPY